MININRRSISSANEKIFNQNLDRLRSEIDSYLLEASSAPYPENLYQPMKYFLELSGKRLRPLLTLISCQAVSGEYSKALPAAIAIELLHNFTLVHDDIMDQDRMRRGKPTVHTKWSESVAILTGDGLIGLAYRTLLNTPHDSLPQVLKIFTEGVIKVCEGQAIDKDFEDRGFVSMQEYFEMIEKKTGELIAVSTEIGGIIGIGESDKSKALRKFGEYIGRAFQIQDDIFDIISSESVLGKDLGSDLAQGKKTYAIIRIQEYTPPEKWEYVKNILKSRSVNSETLNNIKNIMSEYGILQEAKEQIKSDIETAKKYLLEIDDGKWAKDLLDFSTLILNRKK